MLQTFKSIFSGRRSGWNVTNMTIDTYCELWTSPVRQVFFLSPCQSVRYPFDVIFIRLDNCASTTPRRNDVENAEAPRLTNLAQAKEKRFCAVHPVGGFTELGRNIYLLEWGRRGLASWTTTSEVWQWEIKKLFPIHSCRSPILTALFNFNSSTSLL